MKVILASSSLRRIEMMNEFNIDYLVIPSLENEDVLTNDPILLVKELSKKKALSVFNNHKDSLVLGFDTVVYINGEILGKPKDEEDCIRMINLLKNNKHTVYTGSCILMDGYINNFVTSTDVYMDDISDEDIIKYSKTDEPYDKAGAYAIQGFIGKYITKFDGYKSNVIGMPKEIIYKILKDIIK